MSRGGNSFAFYNAGGTCVSFTGGNPNPFLACNGDGARAVGGLGGGTLPTSIDNLLMGGGGGGGAVVRSNNVTLPSVFDGGLSGANFPLADTHHQPLRLRHRRRHSRDHALVPTTTAPGDNCLRQLQTTKRTTTPLVTFP